MLSIYYGEAAEVLNDAELNAMLNELRTHSVSTEVSTSAIEFMSRIYSCPFELNVSFH
jgi:hypothetical protein